MTHHPTLTQRWFRWTVAGDFRMYLFVFPAMPAVSWLVASAYQGSADAFVGGGWLFAVCLVSTVMGAAALRGQSLDSTVALADHEDLIARYDDACAERDALGARLAASSDGTAD